jgi:general stress protein 26
MKTTNASEDPRASARLHDLIEDITVAMLTTVTPEGELRSRPMLTREVKEDREIWFLLLDDAGVAGDLAAERGVNVSYAAPARDRYVSVTGNADVVHDAVKLNALWDDSLEKYFPGGIDNPHLALLRVRVEYAEYWDGAGGSTVPVGGKSRRRKGRGEAAASAGDNHVKVDVREARASG